MQVNNPDLCNMEGISVQTGHVLIVGIAVLAGMFMLKLTKKVIGLGIAVITIAVITKYFGIW